MSPRASIPARIRGRARVRQRLRRATRKARILPAYLIIGAQRAGTTSLLNFLLRHPDVCGPAAGAPELSWSRKEVHFFDVRFSLGADWYRAFFPLAASRRIARLRGGDLMAGESTPYYLFHPLVPERVAATIPAVKLIVLLRDPVDRAYSHYQMMHRSGREKLSFEEALAAEEERLGGSLIEAHTFASDEQTSRHHRHHAYFARGLYADQLERWFRCFPREQLLVLGAEEFFDDPLEACTSTLAFLGLRPYDLSAPSTRATTASPNRPWSSRETRNRAKYEPLDPELRAALERRYAEPNARLAELLGREFGWNRTPPLRGRAASAD